MLKGLIGKKIGMTRLFLAGGRAAAVTLVEVGPCTVTQIKTPDKDRYSAVQLGFGRKKAARVNKPLGGHFGKAGVDPAQVLKEFKVADPGEFEVGQEITAEMFATGDRLKVTGRSKGRGFTGVVKRYGFSGGRDTHGCTTHDAPGSIGMSATPSRVLKGKRMPGRHGNVRRQVRGVKVVDVRPDHNLVVLQGAIPGANGGIVYLEKM